MVNLANSIGETFNELTVLSEDEERNNKIAGKKYVIVQCNCGTIKSISIYDLVKTKSCGCIFSRNAYDLTGLVFERWTVIKYSHKNKSKEKCWLCRCACGVERSITGHSLRGGKSKSCGCINKEKSRNKLNDLTGMIFGKLTVLRYYGMLDPDGKITKRHAWVCLCECGNETIVRGDILKIGDTRSCGCLAKSLNGLTRDRKAYKKYRQLNPSQRLKENISRVVVKALQTTNNTKNGGSTFDYLPYTIQELKQYIESLWESWMSWDNYGGKTDDPRKTWHIDHIIPHSSFAYTSLDDPLFLECWALSNLRPLDKIANMEKGNR